MDLCWHWIDGWSCTILFGRMVISEYFTWSNINLCPKCLGQVEMIWLWLCLGRSYPTDSPSPYTTHRLYALYHLWYTMIIDDYSIHIDMYDIVCNVDFIWMMTSLELRTRVDFFSTHPGLFGPSSPLFEGFSHQIDLVSMQCSIDQKLCI